MNKKLLFIILLAVVIIGFVAFWFYRESMFSKGILRLDIFGPGEAEAGEEIEYTVKYKNNGNFVLENPILVFDMPENSFAENGKSRISQDLEDIYPGDEELIKIKARLLGKEGDLKTARASVSYTPKNLTVRYESNTSFTTKIEAVAVTLDFDLPSKVEKGKELQYSINYFSNIDYPLQDLGLKITSASGFEIKSSDPASLDESEWRLESLNKAEGGRVNIKGLVSADAGQTLNFSAQLGIWQNGNFVTIKEASKNVEVIQPLLFISQQVNGSASYIASPGEILRYQIFFRNIGATPFDDLFMVVKLDGQALDTSTIQAQGGQISGNMIIWDYRQAPQLRHLGEREEGEIVFYVKVKSDWNPSGAEESDTVITDEVNISQIIQKFEIKVNYGLVISQEAYFKNPDIENSGPIPPKTGEATTYTIIWEIKNYFNDAKNVKVKAVLPENVNLTGKISPQSESSNFSFDSASREIVWSAGDILAGQGARGVPRAIYFQVSLIPSGSQRGSTAPLIGRAQISGENQFTNTIITAQDSGVNTSLPDDFVNSGGGIVQ